MKTELTILVLGMLLFSCQKQVESDMTVRELSCMKLDEKPNAIDELSETNQPKESTTHEKKIIKDGRIGLQVNDIESAKKRIDSLLIKQGGYYQSENFENTDYVMNYDLKVRIPSERFEKFVASIGNSGDRVLYKEITARDITSEFIDLETRLENKRNYLKRYQELLKQAKTVENILEIEEKTRAIEEEIESTEGRLKYMSDQVAFSTLALSIKKEKDYKFNPEKESGFIERIKESVSKGWTGLIGFIVFLVKIWPLYLIIAILTPIFKRIKRHVKSRRAEKAAKK